VSIGRMVRVLRRQSAIAGLGATLAAACVVGNALFLQPPAQSARSPLAAPAVQSPQFRAPDPLVRSVQAELAESGFYTGPLDGLAGRRTRDAILSFESAARLTRSGERSEALLASLRRYRALGSPAQAAGAPGGSFDAQVAAVQAALSRSAYGPLRADGRFGPQTRDAIVRFQTDHALPVTGEISDALVVELRAVGALGE
jgi:peptidoglycan hydrolase-like protein with peptidoglycan-binding domain